MQTRLLLLSSMFSLILGLSTACSNGGLSGGGISEGDLKLLDQDNGAPLTSPQKNAFTDLVNSLGRIDSAGRAADSGRSLDDPQAEQMRLSLRNNQCSITLTNPGKPTESNFRNVYKFNVSGTAACPVSQFAESTILQEAATRIYGSVIVRYSVSDAIYVGYNDVTAVDFEDFVEAKFSFPRGGSALVGSGRGSGHVDSQTLGRIQIKTTWAVNSLQAQRTSGGIEQVMKLTFSNFEVVLRSKQFHHEGKIVSRYFLNGNEIKVEDFKRYTKSFTLTDAERYGFLD